MKQVPLPSICRHVGTNSLNLAQSHMAQDAEKVMAGTVHDYQLH